MSGGGKGGGEYPVFSNGISPGSPTRFRTGNDRIDRIFGTGGGNYNAADELRFTFGDRIATDEVTAALANEGFNEYFRQNDTLNSITGLRGDDRSAVIRESLGGRDFSNVAADAGLRTGNLAFAARSGVPGFTDAQQDAQQRNLSLARQTLNPVYADAINLTSNQIANPLAPQQSQAAGIFSGLNSNPLASQELSAAQTFDGFRTDPRTLQERDSTRLLADTGFDPLTAEQQAAAAGLQGLGGSDAFQAAAGTGAQTLANTASGAFTGGNPFIDSVFDRAAGRLTERFREDIAPALDTRFAMSGAYGSDAMQATKERAAGEVTDSLADLAANLYGQDYGRERGLQQQAATALGQLQNQGASRQIAALGGLGSIGQQQQQNQLAAGTALGSLGNQLAGRQLGAAGQLADIGESARQQRMASAAGLGDIGSAARDQSLRAATLAPTLADQRRNAKIQKNNLIANVGDQQQQLISQMLGQGSNFFDTRTTSGFEDLAALGSVLGVAPSFAQAASLGAPQTSSSPIATGLGTGIAGATLGGQFGGLPGAAIGGTIGLLGGIFA